MNELKFNIYGFIAPQTRSEYIALLDEALSLTDDLNDQLDCMSALASEGAVAP